MKKLKTIFAIAGLALCVSCYSSENNRLNNNRPNEGLSSVEKERMKEMTELNSLRERAKPLYPNLLSPEMITARHVEKSNEYHHTYIIRFSNLVYEEQGKIFAFPVFHGNMGDALHQDFRNYCYNEGILPEGYGESGFLIRCGKGEVEKTFREFLEFYKSKGIIVKPDLIERHEDYAFVYYNFVIDGVPCYMVVDLFYKEVNYNNPHAVYGLVLDENRDDYPGIPYSLHTGQKFVFGPEAESHGI
jgi:hypothetical protein